MSDASAVNGPAPVESLYVIARFVRRSRWDRRNGRDAVGVEIRGREQASQSRATGAAISLNAPVFAVGPVYAELMLIAVAVDPAATYV